MSRFGFQCTVKDKRMFYRLRFPATSEVVTIRNPETGVYRASTNPTKQIIKYTPIDQNPHYVPPKQSQLQIEPSVLLARLCLIRCITFMRNGAHIDNDLSDLD